MSLEQRRLGADYTAADIATLRELYETDTPLTTITAKLGRTQGSVYRMARRLHLKRPMSIVRKGLCAPTARMSNAILEAAAQPGGFHHSIDIGFPKVNVGCRARVMVIEGKIFQAALGWRNTRYFATKEQAEAAIELPRALPAREVKKIEERGPARLPGEPVITARTKYTIAPPPPAMVYRTNTDQP